MYKKQSKTLQRMKERGWKVGKLGVYERPKSSNARKAGARRGWSKRTIKAIKMGMHCPECAEALPLMVKEIQIHFRNKHHRKLTETEAFRLMMTTRQRSIRKRAPNGESDRRRFEVSGGLPSLGKRS
jgi:hypothetical protein